MNLPTAGEFDVAPPGVLTPKPEGVAGMQWCVFAGGAERVFEPGVSRPGLSGKAYRTGPHVWVGVATTLAPQAFRKWRQGVVGAQGKSAVRTVRGIGTEAVLNRAGNNGPSLVVLNEDKVVAITIQGLSEDEENTLDRATRLARKVLDRVP